MINIKNFELFLITEKLHINKELDEYSDEIYTLMKKSDENKFEFTDIPNKLNICKLIINIKHLKAGLSGQLDLNKSKETKDGWVIYIDLKKHFMLYTLKHELNHALRLTLIGKDKMIKNLNHLKAQNIFAFSKNDEIDNFFYIMYLANDEEINARVMETNGLIKQVFSGVGGYRTYDKITKEYFNSIITGSDAYGTANELINFKCDDIFKKFNENQLNKLFYILEENKSELDRIQDSKFTKLKLIIKTFKDIFNNKTGFSLDDTNIYKPKKGKEFYDKWIPAQGEKLKRRLYSLYDHYQ